MAPAVDDDEEITITFSRPELEALRNSIDEAIMLAQAGHGQHYVTADEVCDKLYGVSDELDLCFDARGLIVDALEGEEYEEEEEDG